LPGLQFISGAATVLHNLRTAARAFSGVVSGRDSILCPGPGHSRKDRSLSVRFDPNAPDGFWVKSLAGDDWRVCRNYVRERLGLTHENDSGRSAESRRLAPEPRRQDDDERRALELASAAAYVGEMRPVRGTPGERSPRYPPHRHRCNLRRARTNRCDRLAPGSVFQRAGHPPRGQRLGCIVGVMTDPIRAKPTGAISRTYVDDDLRKVGQAKTLASPSGIVRLTPNGDVLSGLRLAEGLETALTAMAVGLRPMWATGSTETMKKIAVLPGIDCVTIVADHDAEKALSAAR
jgi:putative DNA primase/helicase